ncbi:hypothetical protein BC831DRAFT_459186 [Entophlyctis helioformis]|nr:hypothetical protein BC831DRAFT_459186 [Entophlyctis helioformis]
MLRFFTSNAQLVARRMLTTKAVVFGAHEAASPVVASKILNATAASHVQAQLAASNFTGKANEVRLLYGVAGVDAPIVSIVGLGKPAKDEHAAAETARLAASKAIAAIQALNKKQDIHVKFDNLGHGSATSEGANLSTYSYDLLKAEDKRASPVTVSPIDGAFAANEWETGAILAQSQNHARRLMETPANLMTPTIFAQNAVEMFAGIPNVQVFVRDRAWIEEHKMGSFLSVARGSDEPPVLVEVHYTAGAADAKPLAFVGKGVTFDTGGISIKPAADMAMMKGDMGGAATALSSTWGIAKLGVPINLRTVIPLTENMPNGRATKPGDVVTAMNGLTIEVDNTDAEGRLILADAIYYAATTYKPHTLLDFATLTGAMVIALGYPFAGVFSTSDKLWQGLEAAGQYREQVSSHVADLKNVGGREGGSCTAAIFLKEFIPTVGEDKTPALDYAHVDIAGVMHTRAQAGYVCKGMTGRPTRSLIAYAKSL